MVGKWNLPDKVVQDIRALAQKCGIKKVILFGSRARGDNRERSDIDLAVSGGKTAEFVASLDDEVWTLLLFDVVNLDGAVQPALLENIDREGVVIYEKIG